MGTRSIVSINKNGRQYAEIYKHYDGYPNNMLFLIARGLMCTFEDGRQEVEEIVPKVLFGLMSGFATTHLEYPDSGDVRLFYYDINGRPLPPPPDVWEEYTFHINLLDSGAFEIQFSDGNRKHSFTLPSRVGASNSSEIEANWHTIISGVLLGCRHPVLHKSRIFHWD